MMRSNKVEAANDRGLGLIEVLVAAALLAIAMTIFGVAYGTSSRTAEISTQMGDATDQARIALAQLDRQVRFGYWVRTVSVTGASSAVQVLTAGSSGLPGDCWVWAVRSTAPTMLLATNFASAAGLVPPALNVSSAVWTVAAENLATTSALSVDGDPIKAYVGVGSVYPNDRYAGAKAHLDLIQNVYGEIRTIALDLVTTARNPLIGGNYTGWCGP